MWKTLQEEVIETEIRSRWKALAAVRTILSAPLLATAGTLKLGTSAGRCHCHFRSRPEATLFSHAGYPFVWLRGSMLPLVVILSEFYEPLCGRESPMRTDEFLYAVTRSA